MVGYQGVGSFDNDNSDGDENCDYYHNCYHYYVIMIIMMKCSQGEGGPWLAIGELVVLYTRPTCDPGP